VSDTSAMMLLARFLKDWISILCFSVSTILAVSQIFQGITWFDFLATDISSIIKRIFSIIEYCFQSLLYHLIAKSNNSFEVISSQKILIASSFK